MTISRALNVACGNTFISSPNWLNVDWGASYSGIQNFDVLKGLPYSESSFDVIYTSHFIEHLQLDDLKLFLLDCLRLLKPGGTIRIVTPCFEEMVYEFLKQLESNHAILASWVQAEILDQCVRTYPGGRIKEFRKLAENNKYLAEYIFDREGFYFEARDENHVTRTNNSRLLFFLRDKNLNSKIFSIKNIFVRYYIKVVCFFLPSWFKRNQMSFTDPGEKHFWVYTFNELKLHLETLGFQKIEKLDFKSTKTGFDDLLKLDKSPIGDYPRKGKQSMFVEAIK